MAIRNKWRLFLFARKCTLIDRQRTKKKMSNIYAFERAPNYSSLDKSVVEGDEILRE